MSEHNTVQVKTLVMLGVRSYTVDIATGWMVYRYEEGKMHVHNTAAGKKPRAVNAVADRALLEKTIQNNRLGKISRDSFISRLAKAGVRLYEVTLDSKEPFVTYITSGEIFREVITPD
jgi:uncharacterized protein YbcV (DUF1398 family)